jgi:hypothetical protein
MVQEITSAGTGSWATALPLTPGLAAIYSVPTDPNEATLFAVGLDETLSVLTLDPSGWTQTQVRQDGATLQQLDSYRVQASVLDANDVNITSAKVLVSTDRPVGVWQAAGNTVLTPVAPVTMTADLKGEITFSIPAEEIDCAVLTVQALDPAGNPTGTPFTVTPDSDVRAFFNGTGSLSDVGTISASTLLTATNSTGQPLLTTLTSLPADQQQAAATAAVGALSQLIKVGTTASPSTANPVQSMRLDMTSGAPVFTTSTNPTNFGRLEAGRELTFSFSHLFDTIGHALRHAAMELSTVVVQWEATAGQWIVNFVVRIGDDIVNFANLVITDMRDAFHVIGGFFHALGADAEAAFDWLKHNILELLKKTGANATVIEGWFTAAPAELVSVVKGIELSTDDFFSSKEQQAHELITYLQTEVEDATFGSSAPIPPPSSDSGSTGNQSALVKDLGRIVQVMNDAPGKWLMDKLLQYLPADDTGPDITVDFSDFVTSLATDVGGLITVATDVITLIQSTAQAAFGTKQGLTETQLTQWFGDLDKTVHDALQLLDDIADSILDMMADGITAIGQYLTYEYEVIAQDSIVGLILDAAGIDPTLSLAHLISLVIAFPATLIGKILGHDSLFPAATVAVAGKGAKAVGNAADGWQTGLGICGAVAQGVWGMADLVGDLQGIVDPETGKRGTASGIIDYFDILCPVVETVFLWPSKTFADGSTAYPFYGGIADDTTDWELLPFVIWSALLPSIFGILSKIGFIDVPTSDFPDGVKDVMSDYLSPFVQMIAGLANTALGTAYSAKNDAGAAAIAGGVLGNMSFILAPLATAWLNDSTEDVPVLVKTVVDVVGNVGAAICIVEASSLPPK